MEKRKYDAKYFADDFPEWKRKRDSLMGRLVYRKVSFYFSSICANMGIQANAVSIFSVLVVLLASGAYLFHTQPLAIFGAVLLNFWAILDDVDGNLARSVKKQPFGEFVDAFSSYLLMALLGISLSVYIYFNGGLFVKSNQMWVLVLGAVTSNSDTFMRLAYQKYKIEDPSVDNKISDSKPLYSRIKEALWPILGFNENTAFLMLVLAVLNWNDIALLYFFIITFIPCLAICGIYIFKVMKISK